MDVRSTVIVDGNAGERARTLDKAALAQALRNSRARTLALFAAYESALGPQLRVPCTSELNPPLWELGHIGWFADWWITRNPQRDQGVAADPQAARAPARQARRGVDADALYNSSEVLHDSRWQLPLPGADATRADLAESLQDTLNRLDQAPETDESLYFFRLALFHEDMHAEAAVYMAQTLGFDPRDRSVRTPAADAPRPWPPRDLQIDAAHVRLGFDGPGFAFDNELGAHTVDVVDLRIDTHVVSWAQFLPFVDSGSYSQPRFWSEPGWAWRQQQARQAPRHLRQRADGVWEQQRWGPWQSIDPMAPACHLSFFEAQAWCRWAGRRLPTEAEWIAASTQDGFVWGQVWEWTASPFAPFTGFTPHPYRDYSQPWFDGRPVLKGASAATASRMRHRQYRNYFTPERNDLFVGFRSVAL
ncbi:MAG TPA: selenoneine synthase SenA [Hydrogenophaga sp.]|uniref:selenoneine synthase SenA n=1 Tax=Hydrogenophaga sp. TaxID=1904254 RepID=UPI002CDD3C47|nr:selenoneine synthase SenA [Hydrogenophaga sp.]HMN94606.1 selenoneine synthase SenA [Hydrogenophaga sp.]